MQQLTPNDIYQRLAEKVSRYNAGLLLDSAMIRSGIPYDQKDVVLAPDLAKDLCLQLIRQGGPAFHVGQAFYRQLQ